MKTATLSFEERMLITNLVSVQPAGAVGDLSLLFRILDKISLTEIERAGANVCAEEVQGPRGPMQQIRWNLPAPDFAKRTIDFEDAEAERLAKILKACIHLTTATPGARGVPRIVEELEKVEK
jgi:hypothetical protein